MTGKQSAKQAARWRIGVLTASVLLLSGCATPTPAPYSELADPQSSEGSVPNGPPADVDADSVRLVGDHDGVTFYLAISSDEEMSDGICILAYGPTLPGGGAELGCGTGGAFSINWAPLGSVSYRPPSADAEDDDGWVQISENLRVFPAA